MQSCLEKRGMEERHSEIVRSDYNIDDQYSASHKDATSDGDARGKGTNHGGHTHFLPDCNKPATTIDYSNFDTFNGGNKYDIDGRDGVGGRRRAMASSLYNQDHQYSANLVNSELNIQEGQFQVR